MNFTSGELTIHFFYEAFQIYSLNKAFQLHFLYKAFPMNGELSKLAIQKTKTPKQDKKLLERSN